MEKSLFILSETKEEKRRDCKTIQIIGNKFVDTDFCFKL